MNKIDFVCFLEVKNANPNGDIDMGNQPRQNDNGFGYMTDVCLKRRIRDCIPLIKEDDENDNFRLYIANDGLSLESKTNEFIETNGGYENIKELTLQERMDLVKNEFKRKYFDVRTFGAVVTPFTKEKYLDGQIRGAVQIGFAESLDEISPQCITISRVSIQTEKDLKQKQSELGNKWIVPYAVYKFEGHINPFIAAKNGFTEEDKEILLNAIMKMYDCNLSASSTGISTLKMFVFEHSSRLGDCNFNKLKNAIKVERIDVVGNECPYQITIEESEVPDTVTVTVME